MLGPIKPLYASALTPGAKSQRGSVMEVIAEQGVTFGEHLAHELLAQQVSDLQSPKGTPTIALVAHDNMKKLMRQFVLLQMDMLKDFRLTGTGTTCAMMRSEGLEPIGSTVSGPLGGDDIGEMIVRGEVNAVFFFRDPFSSHAHIADIEALGRLVDVYQCYYSSNYRSSSAVLSIMHAKLPQRTASQGSVAKLSVVEDLPKAVQVVEDLPEAVEVD